ncbi:Rmf/CrpP fold protein [Amycolatopsis sp. cmx-4-54]|uniref:Rmf/CrpP fold protein n=1 Tax=Amycolatopsis sp. cmx-4-54 TaxID=2790936 RepID=UPI00397CA23B
MSTPTSLSLAALRAGKAAAERGDRSTTCPHDPTSDDVAERVQAKMWRRGYAEGNPVQLSE